MKERLLVQARSSGTRRYPTSEKLVPTLLIIALSLLPIACDKIINSDNDVCDEFRLRKITVGGAQYGLYHYDKNCNIVRYEFWGVQPDSRATRTIYADYHYRNNALNSVEQYVYYNSKYVKTRIEEYEYDEKNRLKMITYHVKSEIDDSWSDSIQEFYYNEHDQLIKTMSPGFAEYLYYYDSNGNAWKWEHYPLFQVEYEGPLTLTYSFDTKKNPLYRHDTRYFLPLANGVLSVALLSPNNVVSWESHSPETGGVISRGSLEYQYNSRGYPISSTETVISPLNSDQPDEEILYTEYEYTQ